MRFPTGRLDSSVGSVFCHAGSISLVSLAKISISETFSKIVPAVVFINGLTVTFLVAVDSQGITRPNA